MHLLLNLGKVCSLVGQKICQQLHSHMIKDLYLVDFMLTVGTVHSLERQKICQQLHTDG